MTAVLDIITDAYRESNLIGKGVVPDETEQTDGLRRLQAVVDSTAGFEVGESLQDWPIGLNNVDVYPPFYNAWNQEIWMRPLENVRLLIDTSITQTIEFPMQPNDGARMAVVDVSGQLATYPITLSGNGRLIDGADSVVLNMDGFTTLYFYRADLANWVTVSPIALDGTFPFPPEFDDAFVTMLAMRLNPRYGRALSAETTAALTNAWGNLKARYAQSQSRPADIGVLNLSVQVYNTWNGRGRQPWWGRAGWMR